MIMRAHRKSSGSCGTQEKKIPPAEIFSKQPGVMAARNANRRSGGKVLGALVSGKPCLGPQVSKQQAIQLGHLVPIGEPQPDAANNRTAGNPGAPRGSQRVCNEVQHSFTCNLDTNLLLSGQ